MKLLGLLDEVPIRHAYRIAFLTNFYRAPLLRRMEKEFNLIRPEWTVLLCLAYRDGLNPRDICEFTEQPRNTVSRGVASLERKGMIVSKPDSQDARRTLLSLTKRGRRTYDAVMPMFVEGEAKMLACLTSAEVRQLDRLLDKLGKAVPGWANALTKRGVRARKTSPKGVKGRPDRSGTTGACE